ncbi:hypothetical protein X797_008376 [Metarhizium robertsii]|uniref:Uncharacterized protein n=1 Tax=Metarhizium robertsii TaxID=568076 RepID=A0A0A1URM5_9HYPO|nr:hypothetical protein X797_008376 [Metarhizium robertsii]
MSLKAIGPAPAPQVPEQEREPGREFVKEHQRPRAHLEEKKKKPKEKKKKPKKKKKQKQKKKKQKKCSSKGKSTPPPPSSPPSSQFKMANGSKRCTTSSVP